MESHIKIGGVAPRVQYVADGVNTKFGYAFVIFGDEDLEVYIGSALQSSGYVVNGAGQSSGGHIVFDVPPDNGATVTLRRSLLIERTTDFQPSGEFRAKVINDELDYQIAAIQEIEANLGRCIRLQSHDDDSAALELPTRDERLGKLLGFSSLDGSIELVEVGSTPGAADHDSLPGFVDSEHLDHTDISIDAGSGLAGGGTIATSRVLALDAGHTRNVDHASVAVTGVGGLAGGGALTQSRQLRLNLGSLEESAAFNRAQDWVAWHDTSTGLPKRSRLKDLNPTVFDARDFGYVGDGIADDTAALNALFDKVRASITNFGGWNDVAFKVYIPPSVTRITDTINMSAINVRTLVIDAAGVSIRAALDGVPAFDCVGSGGLKFRPGLRLHGMRGANGEMGTFGFQFARLVTSITIWAGNNALDGVTVDGYWSKSAVVNYGTEQFSAYDCQFYNADYEHPGSRCVVITATNAIGVVASQAAIDDGVTMATGTQSTNQHNFASVYMYRHTGAQGSPQGQGPFLRLEADNTGDLGNVKDARFTMCYGNTGPALTYGIDISGFTKRFKWAGRIEGTPGNGPQYDVMFDTASLQSVHEGFAYEAHFSAATVAMFGLSNDAANRDVVLRDAQVRVTDPQHSAPLFDIGLSNARFLGSGIISVTEDAAYLDFSALAVWDGLILTRGALGNVVFPAAGGFLLTTVGQVTMSGEWNLNSGRIVETGIVKLPMESNLDPAADSVRVYDATAGNEKRALLQNLVSAATTSDQGKVRLAADRENAASAAVQGNDARLNRPIVTIADAGRALTAADAWAYVRTTSATAVTISVNAGVFAAGDEVHIRQAGAGSVNLAGTAAANGSFAFGEHTTAVLKFLDANTYDITPGA